MMSSELRDRLEEVLQERLSKITINMRLEYFIRKTSVTTAITLFEFLDQKLNDIVEEKLQNQLSFLRNVDLLPPSSASSSTSLSSSASSSTSLSVSGLSFSSSSESSLSFFNSSSASFSPSSPLAVSVSPISSFSLSSPSSSSASFPSSTLLIGNSSTNGDKHRCSVLSSLSSTSNKRKSPTDMLDASCNGKVAPMTDEYFSGAINRTSTSSATSVKRRRSLCDDVHGGGGGEQRASWLDAEKREASSDASVIDSSDKLSSSKNNHDSITNDNTMVQNKTSSPCRVLNGSMEKAEQLTQLNGAEGQNPNVLPAADFHDDVEYEESAKQNLNLESEDLSKTAEEFEDIQEQKTPEHSTESIEKISSSQEDLRAEGTDDGNDAGIKISLQNNLHNETELFSELSENNTAEVGITMESFEEELHRETEILEEEEDFDKFVEAIVQIEPKLEDEEDADMDEARENSSVENGEIEEVDVTHREIHFALSGKLHEQESNKGKRMSRSDMITHVIHEKEDTMIGEEGEDVAETENAEKENASKCPSGQLLENKNSSVKAYRADCPTKGDNCNAPVQKTKLQAEGISLMNSVSFSDEQHMQRLSMSRLPLTSPFHSRRSIRRLRRHRDCESSLVLTPLKKTVTPISLHRRSSHINFPSLANSSTTLQKNMTKITVATSASTTHTQKAPRTKKLTSKPTNSNHIRTLGKPAAISSPLLRRIKAPLGARLLKAETEKPRNSTISNISTEVVYNNDEGIGAASASSSTRDSSSVDFSTKVDVHLEKCGTMLAGKTVKKGARFKSSWIADSLLAFVHGNRSSTDESDVFRYITEYAHSRQLEVNNRRYTCDKMLKELFKGRGSVPTTKENMLKTLKSLGLIKHFIIVNE